MSATILARSGRTTMSTSNTAAAHQIRNRAVSGHAGPRLSTAILVAMGKQRCEQQRRNAALRDPDSERQAYLLAGQSAKLKHITAIGNGSTFKAPYQVVVSGLPNKQLAGQPDSNVPASMGKTPAQAAHLAISGIHRLVPGAVPHVGSAPSDQQSMQDANLADICQVVPTGKGPLENKLWKVFIQIEDTDRIPDLVARLHMLGPGNPLVDAALTATKTSYTICNASISMASTSNSGQDALAASAPLFITLEAGGADPFSQHQFLPNKTQAAVGEFSMLHFQEEKEKMLKAALATLRDITAQRDNAATASTTAVRLAAAQHRIDTQRLTAEGTSSDQVAMLVDPQDGSTAGDSVAKRKRQHGESDTLGDGATNRTSEPQPAPVQSAAAPPAGSGNPEQLPAFPSPDNLSVAEVRLVMAAAEASSCEVVLLLEAACAHICCNSPVLTLIEAVRVSFFSKKLRSSNKGGVLTYEFASPDKLAAFIDLGDLSLQADSPTYGKFTLSLADANRLADSYFPVRMKEKGQVQAASSEEAHRAARALPSRVSQAVFSCEYLTHLKVKQSFLEGTSIGNIGPTLRNLVDGSIKGSKEVGEADALAFLGLKTPQVGGPLCFPADRITMLDGTREGFCAVFNDPRSYSTMLLTAMPPLPPAKTSGSPLSIQLLPCFPIGLTQDHVFTLYSRSSSQHDQTLAVLAAAQAAITGEYFGPVRDNLEKEYALLSAARQTVFFPAKAVNLATTIATNKALSPQPAPRPQLEQAAAVPGCDLDALFDDAAEMVVNPHTSAVRNTGSVGQPSNTPGSGSWGQQRPGQFNTPAQNPGPNPSHRPHEQGRGRNSRGNAGRGQRQMAKQGSKRSVQ